MTRLFCTLTLFMLFGSFFISKAHAATPLPVATSGALLATESATATTSARTEERTLDITQTTVESKSKLAAYLDEVPVQTLRPWNVLQRGLRHAVQQGVPANILVLLLLFPVIATAIAIFRHIIGLRGFGIYTPAVLAVAFISTGIVRGIALFSVVLITVVIGRSVLNLFRLQYLPRTALLLWFVSFAMFLLMLVSPYLPLSGIASVGIFPLLMLVLLSENFLEAQLLGNALRSLQLTLETLFLAVIATVFMRTFEVQKFVMIYPELTVILVLAMNILVGKYTGLRVSEFFRFKPLIDPEE